MVVHFIPNIKLREPIDREKKVMLAEPTQEAICGLSFSITVDPEVNFSLDVKKATCPECKKAFDKKYSCCWECGNRMTKEDFLEMTSEDEEIKCINCKSK